MTPDERIQFCVEQTQKIVNIASALQAMIAALQRMEARLQEIETRIKNLPDHR